MGADFRLKDAGEWEASYGAPHAGAWTYGLPELPGQRDALHATNRVAAAGCYPTATSLALAPLLAAGLVEPTDLVVVASSGTTGAGRAAKTNLLGSEVMGDLVAYKVASHQHAPEIRQTLGDVAGTPVTMSFTTVLAPMPRGILAIATARVLPGITEAMVRNALSSAYADEPFVHVLPEGRWPHTAATLGSNSCQLQVALDAQVGRAVVVSAIDNLGKGAAGQAVQIANLLLGFDESTGLTADGVAP
jgi:N-acetyl-gamma-glutamyl-phosphate reductase